MVYMIHFNIKILNPDYINLTIQRVSTKYDCLQVNDRKDLHYFTRNQNKFFISPPNDLLVLPKKVPEAKSYKNQEKIHQDEFYEWPQISTIIVSPKLKSKSKQKTEKKDKSKKAKPSSINPNANNENKI